MLYVGLQAGDTRGVPVALLQSAHIFGPSSESDANELTGFGLFMELDRPRVK